MDDKQLLISKSLMLNDHYAYIYDSRNVFHGDKSKIDSFFVNVLQQIADILHEQVECRYLFYFCGASFNFK